MADQSYGESKACSKCGEVKPLEDFARSARGLYGRRSDCKSCHQAFVAAYKEENRDHVLGLQRARYRANPEKAAAATRKWREANLESDRAKDRAYKAANRETMNQKARERIAQDRKGHNEKGRKWREANPERARELAREWAKRNREKVRQYQAARRTEPKIRLTNAIRSGVHRGLTGGAKAGRSTFVLLGYTPADLIAHLEKQFLTGMSWENYGEWHVDHKIPLAAFNFETPTDSDFGRAWALSNLRPLWSKLNHEKKDRLDRPFQPSLLL